MARPESMIEILRTDVVGGKPLFGFRVITKDTARPTRAPLISRQEPIYASRDVALVVARLRVAQQQTTLAMEPTLCLL